MHGRRWCGRSPVVIHLGSPVTAETMLSGDRSTAEPHVTALDAESLPDHPPHDVDQQLPLGVPVFIT